MNLIASYGVSRTIRRMSVIPTRAWGSLGCALLGAIVLSGCGTLPHSSPPSTPVATKSNAAAVESGGTLSLQRQIRERNKRIAELQSHIAELTSQMEALKVIDQDMDEQRNSRRPPATLTPIETDQGRQPRP
jgi:TolA-binding protein